MNTSTIWDRPVTDAELDRFYGNALTQTAIEIGQDRVTNDASLFAEFVQESLGEAREPSKAFGPITTDELIIVLMSRVANDRTLADAARELRGRFLAMYQGLQDEAAQEAMEP